MKELPVAARIYILTLVAIAAALLVLLVMDLPAVPNTHVLIIFALLTVLGELRVIKAPVGTDGVTLTFSTAFAFAILITFGVV